MQPFETRRRRTNPADDVRAAPVYPDDTARTHCRVWLDWAVTQINRSLADDSEACERLLAALDALMSAAQGRLPGTLPADDAIGAKMTEVVVAVQSHDRLMQQLTHVGESLRGLHEHLADPCNAGSAESWRTLRERQLRAFSMSEERALFAGIVGAASGEQYQESDGASSADATLLFDDLHGVDEPAA